MKFFLDTASLGQFPKDTSLGILDVVRAAEPGARIGTMPYELFEMYPLADRGHRVFAAEREKTYSTWWETAEPRGVRKGAR
jgi:hypothetical protein